MSKRINKHIFEHYLRKRAEGVAKHQAVREAKGGKYEVFQRALRAYLKGKSDILGKIPEVVTIRKPSVYVEHVRITMQLEDVSYREAQTIIKKKPFWVKKRALRMSKASLKTKSTKGFQEAVKPKRKWKGTFIEVEGEEYYV